MENDQGLSSSDSVVSGATKISELGQGNDEQQSKAALYSKIYQLESQVKTLEERDQRLSDLIDTLTESYSIDGDAKNEIINLEREQEAIDRRTILLKNMEIMTLHRKLEKLQSQNVEQYQLEIQFYRNEILNLHKLFDKVLVPARN